MIIERQLKHEQDTNELARNLARILRSGDVIALHGDLGAGKTALCRHLIRVLSKDADTEVPSPTFTLVQTYDSSLGEIWHFDLYRVHNSEDILELGWDEALGAGLILIEWPDRLGGWLPVNRLDINLHFAAEGDERRVRLSGDGDWPQRLAQLAQLAG